MEIVISRKTKRTEYSEVDIPMRRCGIFSSIFGIAQSIVWATVSILFISMYLSGGFNYESDTNEDWFAFYKIYIKTGGTGPIKIIKLMSLYGCISALWFFVSLWLIIRIKNRDIVNPLRSVTCAYLFWSVITFIICIIDVIVTLMVVFDLINLMNSTDSNALMGDRSIHFNDSTNLDDDKKTKLIVKRSADDIENSSKKTIKLNFIKYHDLQDVRDGKKVTARIMMMAFTFRVIIIWAINLCCSVLIFNAYLTSIANKRIERINHYTQTPDSLHLPRPSMKMTADRLRRLSTEWKTKGLVDEEEVEIFSNHY